MSLLFNKLASANIRLGWKGLPGTIAILFSPVVNYDRKKFFNNWNLRSDADTRPSDESDWFKKAIKMVNICPTYPHLIQNGLAWKKVQQH